MFFWKAIFLIYVIQQSFCQKDNHFTVGRSTMVHLFEWKWKDIAEECENFLGPKGFAGVQISPPTENQIIRITRANRPWWERYQPVSYQFISRSGTEDELIDMVQRCNNVGVRIYVDVLMNGMAQKAGKGMGGNSAYPSIMFYPAVTYIRDEFNKPCTVNDYNDANNVRNCQLVGLPDLNQSLYSVRKKLLQYIDRLLDLGVAGIRVDAAKHMWPSDLKYIYDNAQNLSTKHGFAQGTRPYIYQEVPDLGGEAVSKFEYVDIGDVLEFNFGVQLGNIIQGNQLLHILKDWGSPSWYLVKAQDGVVFIDNHDNQRLQDTRILSFKKPKLYRAANSFMLAHPFFTPRLMSSFLFEDHDQGPPSDENDDTTSPGFNPDGSCNNGWVCEHRWHQIYNMVRFRNVCLGTRITNWWDNGQNQIAFGRENQGFIAMTIEGDINAILQTSLPPGTYCDVISGDLIDGECTGKVVVVDQEGKADIYLDVDGEDYMLAIHIGVMTEGTHEGVVSDETPITSDLSLGTKPYRRLPKEATNNNEPKTTETEEEEEEFVPQIRWPDTIVQLYLHLGCLYGLYLCIVSAKFYTTLFALLTVYTSGFGITAGAHRLWSHRSYKAKWPLRLLLVLLFTITGQRHVYAWALDHRVHHKYSETDADPHNAKKGFFFAHVGWLVVTPHPKVVEKRNAVDMSDLETDAIVMWQKKYYPPLFLLFNIILPVSIPVYFWNETIWNSFWINFNTRFTLTLNIAFFVNSAAHMWGQKPYDKYISSVENLAVSLAALGEGWHNYHHVFPWDYKTGELGNVYNPSTSFINFFARLGWAYDLKSVSNDMILRRAQKTGDGTHPDVWGYGDEDIDKADMDELIHMAEENKFFKREE
ncbi:alpha-amylase-like [Diabrotica undecimpunctata]|uniref:alpha-amylase-like n=2 Tax=Diabrotica undecimpunctata TaxID=50387 RepID=UPI003B633BCF